MRQTRKELTKVPRTPDLVDFTRDNCMLINKNSSLNGVYRDYAFQPNFKCITMQDLMDQCSPGIYATLELCIDKKAPIKAYLTIEALFYKINFTDGSVVEEKTCYMSTRATSIQTKTDIDKLVSNSKAYFDEKIESFTNRGSNWIIQQITSLIVKIVSTN